MAFRYIPRIMRSAPLYCLLGGVLGVSSFAAPAFSGGFYVPEIGPRAVGMGGAMAAQSADPSAIVHNPAGIAGLEGTQLQLGGALFLPDIRYYRRPLEAPAVSFAEVKNENRFGVAPYFGATFPSGIRDVTLGVAAYVPFGAALRYPGEGAQRFVVTGIELRTFFVSPTVAYRLTDRLRVGASLSYIYADLDLQQKNALNFVTGDPESNLDLEDPSLPRDREGTNHLSARDPASLGASVGFLYTDADDRFRMGVSVMTPTTLTFQGDAHIENATITELEGENHQVVQSAGQRDDEFRMDFPLPLIVRVGTLFQPHPRFKIAFDVNWQRWSTSKTMTVDFQNEHELLATPGAYLYDVSIANDWHDTLSVRMGAEAMPLSRRPLALRVGLLYDQSPIDERHFDLLAPDSDKIGVSAGLGYAFRVAGQVLDVDLAFLHLFFQERDVAPGSVPFSDTNRPIPGSDKTIQNKPAPSFYYGVTRARVELLYLALSWRM